MGLLGVSLLTARNWARSAAERQKTIPPMAQTSSITLAVREAGPCQTSPATAKGQKMLKRESVVRGGGRRQDARAQTVLVLPHNAWPIFRCFAEIIAVA